MLSRSNSAEFIRKKLEDVDLVVLDEAHILSLPSLPQVDFDRKIPLPVSYGFLTDIYEKWRFVMDENRRRVNLFESEVKQNPLRHTGITASTHFHPNPIFVLKAWGELFDLATNRALWGLNDDDILALRDIILIMIGDVATISYLTKNGSGRMVVSSSQGRIHFPLMLFLRTVTPKAQVVFVSETLIEKITGFFYQLSGRNIKTAIFPDLNDANDKMYIHPSTWRFSVSDGPDGINHAIKEIREISESVGHQPIYLLAMNTRHAAFFKKKLQDLPNITVDYYRSPNSIGVAQSARICIAVGAAELPRHVCDPLVQGNDKQKRYLESQQLRINAVDLQHGKHGAG